LFKNLYPRRERICAANSWKKRKKKKKKMGAPPPRKGKDTQPPRRGKREKRGLAAAIYRPPSNEGKIYIRIRGEKTEKASHQKLAASWSPHKGTRRNRLQPNS